MCIGDYWNFMRAECPLIDPSSLVGQRVGSFRVKPLETQEDRDMNLRNKLAVVGVGGAMFTGAAFGLAGVASADSSGVGTDRTTASSGLGQSVDGLAIGSTVHSGPDGDDSEPIDELESSAEDEAVFDRYDQCLVDNGVDGSFFVDVGGADSAETFEIPDIDGDVDAAFEACDPILEDLTGDMFGLSAEDEDVFERYDACLVEHGVDMSVLVDDEGDEIVESFEFDGDLVAAFEACDLILEEAPGQTDLGVVIEDLETLPGELEGIEVCDGIVEPMTIDGGEVEGLDEGDWVHAEGLEGEAGAAS